MFRQLNKRDMLLFDNGSYLYLDLRGALAVWVTRSRQSAYLLIGDGQLMAPIYDLSRYGLILSKKEERKERGGREKLVKKREKKKRGKEKNGREKKGGASWPLT